MPDHVDVWFVGMDGLMIGADQRARFADRLRGGSLALASCVAFAAVWAPASAQEAADEPVGVAVRPRPEYDPIGVRLGAFVARPQLNVDLSYDDNVFARPNEQSDTIVRVTPKLSVTSDWPRHLVSLKAEGRFSRYDKFKNEDTDEWLAGASGRLDVRRDFNLKFDASHADKVEPRTSEVYLFTPLDPVTYTQDSVLLSASKTFNRLQVTGSAGATDFSYDDTRDVIGDILDQGYRDRLETEATLRLAYAVSPKSAFFIEGGALRHEYDRPSPLGVSRDANGYTVLLGVEGELTRLVHGEVSAGLVHYDFSNPAAGDVNDFNYRVKLTWYPTELLTVGLDGAQKLHDTPLPTTPGYLVQSLSLTADYELRRNLIVTGRLAASREDYQGIDRTDRRYAGSLAAKYLLTRGVGISVRYNHEQRDSSSVAAAGFQDNVVGVGVTLER